MGVSRGFCQAWVRAEHCGQLCKSHDAELLGTTEATHPTIAAVTSHTAGKRTPGKKVHQLREQQLASVHRRLQKASLKSASRQFQIDTPNTSATIGHQAVAGTELVVNRAVVRLATEFWATITRAAVLLCVCVRRMLFLFLSNSASHCELLR